MLTHVDPSIFWCGNSTLTFPLFQSPPKALRLGPCFHLRSRLRPGHDDLPQHFGEQMGLSIGSTQKWIVYKGKSNSNEWFGGNPHFKTPPNEDSYAASSFMYNCISHLWWARHHGRLSVVVADLWFHSSVWWGSCHSPKLNGILTEVTMLQPPRNKTSIVDWDQSWTRTILLFAGRKVECTGI